MTVALYMIRCKGDYSIDFLKTILNNAYKILPESTHFNHQSAFLLYYNP